MLQARLTTRRGTKPAVNWLTDSVRRSLLFGLFGLRIELNARSPLTLLEREGSKNFDGRLLMGQDRLVDTLGGQWRRNICRRHCVMAS